ncbi:MAG: sterol desaturase family protein [Acidobacteria bacterium]|jgi:sterol desaturase/sphingolipid hydroxylase (fatty acid hydroxylase superfamily)|nr:sterol desaturase family protein [Acidobacteriota bacterium]
MALKTLVSWLMWPLAMGLAIAATAWGIAIGRGPLVFAVSYLLFAAWLWAMERWMPHEPAWLENDGQIFPDFAHTALSKSFAYALVVFGGSAGLFQAWRGTAGLWPAGWPLAFQVLLGLAIAEFGFYWGHRLAHEWPFLWRFHAIHHSVTRLWFFNTGRFHIGDTQRAMLFGLPLLFASGAPEIVFTWVSAITAFVGLLTHCNVTMRTGWLHRVFVTPGLHRWHHSRDPREGNRNYGENLSLWDQLFGTYFDPPARPPRDIGIDEAMPAGFLGQLAAPFRARG